MTDQTAQAEKTKTYVVYGSHYWGSGKTEAEAKAQFRKEGGRLMHGYAVMVFDEDTTFHGIDDFARYTFTGNPPTETVHEKRTRQS